MFADHSTNHEVLLTCRQIQERTGLSRSTILRKVRDGTFPAPVKTGKRAVRWRESDVSVWIDSCPPSNGEAAKGKEG